MNVEYFDAHEAHGVQREAGWYRFTETVARSDGRIVTPLVGPFATKAEAAGEPAEDVDRPAGAPPPVAPPVLAAAPMDDPIPANKIDKPAELPLLSHKPVDEHGEPVLGGDQNVRV